MRNILATLPLMIAIGTAVADEAAPVARFAEIQRTMREFCFDCHSTEVKEGELDLKRFSSVESVQADLKPWQAMIMQLETGEMPPKDQPQPSQLQRQRLLDWTRRLLNSEARRRAGERGSVPLHRLSNSQYNSAIRDLTGIDLQPTREFPDDGVAGEGFTNAAEALSMSPVLMSKYVKAAKDIADHAILLPDGFRFSDSATRRDWTDESLARLRNFYRQFTHEGSLPLKPYIAALVEHRSDLESNTLTLDQVAKEKNLSPKYLAIIWETLNDSHSSFPLDRVHARWENAATIDVDEIVVEIVVEASAWFDRLWEFPRIGSYVNTHRQEAKNPVFRESHTISVELEPTPGQSEVVLRLVAHRIGGPATTVVWSNPRFVRNDLPTLALRDYESYGPRYEVDFARLFSDTEAYLAAVIEAAFHPDLSVSQIATKHKLDPVWLERWVSVVDLQPRNGDEPEPEPGRAVQELSWQLLNEPALNSDHPSVNGWRPKDADLPVLVTNASDETKHVPGRMSPRSVAVHPTPSEFVAVVWTSPITGRIRIHGKVDDAHSDCGNGVAWWLEKRAPARSTIIVEGNVDLGRSVKLTEQHVSVTTGDHIILGIDARDSSHVCDLTEIELVVTDTNTPGRLWNLASDTANSVAEGNPHDDSYGNRDVWSFVKGAAKDRPTGNAASNGNSILRRWRIAASMPSQRKEADAFAVQLRNLLAGPRPKDEANPDRALYDQLVSVSGPLLKGIDIVGLSDLNSAAEFALPQARFGVENNLTSQTADAIEVRLPAALFHDRAFVVDGKLGENSAQSAVQFEVLTEPPSDFAWDKDSPIVVQPDGEGQKRLLAGLADFRRVFPPNVCYPHIIPLDEVVCLKTFHREDEPLRDLFLSDEQTAQLEQLWQEHRFISRFPLVENEYLPLFIGFVTQDQPKELVELFESKRPEFQRWADEFEKDLKNAAPQQLAQLSDFASRAYRRPLSEAETQGLNSLYKTLREKEVDHETAFRSVLARVLMSPSFLLHLEQPGAAANTVDDWTLASRLSFFLWSSLPDEELRQLANAGCLHEPEVLAEQTRRMLADDRVRSLAVEFGTQWIHVRQFDQFNEKNAALFPEFGESLRSAMYEEAISVFRNLFQRDGGVIELIDADYTYLNETLAKHYAIEGVVGNELRRVEGVKKFGRGGILGLASVQSKQSGASRTSPILRGNWIVETLLGEKLPLPPPGVPVLPESEIGNDGLTMRQITERHTSDPQCASCHQRIDPFGLAMEQYDPIGRLREQDLGGLLVDATATLKDGTQLEGFDGLKQYLVMKKRETIVRVFYQRLLGYALGRAVSIPDHVLLDEMLAQSDEGQASVTNAIVAIVQSPQFQRPSDEQP